MAPKIIELDGRAGEGGGQLVRVAVGLAALTTQPVKITNVRGNRPGGRGGGASPCAKRNPPRGQTKQESIQN
jgi:RNA 3'-terminal phosphate cyclase (ATP)